MRNIIFLIIINFNANDCISQKLTFEKYIITSMGYISIPSNMEVQTGHIKRVYEELLKIYSFEASGNEIVFQPKGLNNNDISEKKIYARIMIETIIGNKGDYELLSNKLLISQKELIEINSELKSQIENEFINTGLKLIKWNPLKIETINGFSCVKTSYVRQLNLKPEVEVNIYQFQNNDRLHRITISYQKSEEATWLPIHAFIINSINITNSR
jgi:hypothetical protein